MKRNKLAFTLAEVLITHGIIGVVAAMTMPSLITSYKKQETSGKTKKIQLNDAAGSNFFSRR